MAALECKVIIIRLAARFVSRCAQNYVRNSAISARIFLASPVERYRIDFLLHYELISKCITLHNHITGYADTALRDVRDDALSESVNWILGMEN